MLCEICGKNEATFHYSEVVNGKKTEHHLCNECAANTDISYYSSLFDNEGGIGQLLSGLLGNAFGIGEPQDPKKHIMCPRCGMSYGEFVKNSTFGCNECYDVFGPLLDDSIKKLQGSLLHAGKKPKLGSSVELFNEEAENKEEDEAVAASDSQLTELRKEVEVLSRRLKLAVAEEDFEEAARLRDKIKEMKLCIERISDNA